MTDQSLLSEVQAALVEPADGGATWPSGLWVREEVTAQLTERQHRFLKDTLALISVSSNITVNIGDHRLALPADWIRTVSVVWLGSDGTIRELLRADSFEADHAIPTWAGTNGTPIVYMEYDAEQLEIQIAPGPTVAGNLSLLYVAKGTTLTGDGTSLTVPDDLAHALKYGLLADLLSKDGRGKDPGRAGYCEERFALAIEASRLMLKGWA